MWEVTGVKREIIGVRAVKITGGERMVATFADGSEAILVKKTTRLDFAVCVVHSEPTKSGATKDCPEASYITMHGEGVTPKPSRFCGHSDQIVKILRVERAQ